MLLSLCSFGMCVVALRNSPITTSLKLQLHIYLLVRCVIKIYCLIKKRTLSSSQQDEVCSHGFPGKINCSSKFREIFNVVCHHATLASSGQCLGCSFLFIQIISIDMQPPLLNWRVANSKTIISPISRPFHAYNSWPYIRVTGSVLSCFQLMCCFPKGC